MRSTGSGLAPIVYLQRRIIRNWFRRSMRSPLFWIIAGFLMLTVIGQVAAIIDGPDQSDTRAWLEPVYREAIGAVALGSGILIGLWRGTSTVPAASLADVVVLMGSPIPARLQYGLLMARSSLVNALVLSVWLLVGVSGLILGAEDSWTPVRLLFTAMMIALLSEFLRYAVWVGTEQVMVGSASAGRRLRSVIRAGVIVLAAGLGAVLLVPVGTATDPDWREVLQLLVDQGGLLAATPPMSLAAGVLAPGGASFLSALALLLFVSVTAGLAIFWARDFVEPISVTAEHNTDARGQMLETGSDVQWAALAQFGVSPRQRTSVPAFGRGPWALLWGSLNRWVRYQVAAAGITIVMLGSFGVLAGIGVRIGFVPVEAAWGVAVLFPFFGSVNMFMDELRRQFIFLIPGSSWARLAAGAITSVLDGLVASLLVIVVLLVLGAIPLSHAAGLLMLGLAVALLGQACLALVQVIMPVWVGHRIRVTATFGLTGIAFLPALLVLVGFYLAVGPVVGLLTAAFTTMVTGIVALLVAGLLFDQIEYSG